MRTALCIAVLATIGCGGESVSVDRSQLDGVVLQPEDLPRGHEQVFDAATPNGWETRYTGPLVVTAEAELLTSSAQAEAELDAELEHVRSTGWQPVGEPGLGDASFAATTSTPRVYRVFWRQGEILAEIEVRGSISLAEALDLARKQESRIEEAAG